MSIRLPNPAMICTLILTALCRSIFPAQAHDAAVPNSLEGMAEKGQAKTILFTIDSDQKIGPVSPMIYGQMIEHAYWSVHLGLWAQLIDNGGFELDRDKLCHTVAQHWELVSTDEGNEFAGTLDDRHPFNAAFSQQMRIQKYAGGDVRLLQRGLYVKRGVEYKGFVFLRGKNAESIRAALLSNTGEVLASQDLGVVTAETWSRFDLVLQPTVECRNAAFALCFRGEGVWNVDQIQVWPSDTYKGHGTRADMVELYKGLKPAFIRWPGGTYLMWHHWKNGIGPSWMRPVTDGRKVSQEKVGEWDANTFGTDEYLQFCADVGAEPMINVNIKDGLQNTLDWIEYCNGAVNAPWGSQRAGNGHRDPYQVKYWVIDNEPTHRSLEKGFPTEQYPRLAREWAEAMKKKDPGIKVLIMGETGLTSYNGAIPEFTAQVIRETSDVMDWLCVHLYYDNENARLGMPYRMSEEINRIKRVIDPSCHGRDVKIALTEWNPQCYASLGQNLQQLEEKERTQLIQARGAGNMNQAIEGAQLFHLMERASAADVLSIATPCQLCVNVDRYSGTWLRSALVQINNHAAWASPLYHVNALYSRLRQPYLIQIEAQAMPPTHASDGRNRDFPAVDVVATRGESRNLIIIKAVSNSASDEYRMRFDLRPVRKIKAIAMTEIRADSPLAVNTASTPRNVVPKASTISPEGSWFCYTMKPHTVAAMEVTVE